MSMPEIEAARQRYEDAVMRLVALACEDHRFMSAATVAGARLTAAFNERIIARNLDRVLLDRLLAGLRAGGDPDELARDVDVARDRAQATVLAAKVTLGEAVHELVAAMLDHGDDEQFALAITAAQAKAAFDDTHASRAAAAVIAPRDFVSPPAAG